MHDICSTAREILKRVKVEATTQRINERRSVWMAILNRAI